MDKVTENKQEEELVEDWEKKVKDTVGELLQVFLPICKDGNVGVVYKKVVKEQMESGPVFDGSKVSGVEIILDFNFTEAVEKPV